MAELRHPLVTRTRPLHPAQEVVRTGKGGLVLPGPWKWWDRQPDPMRQQGLNRRTLVQRASLLPAFTQALCFILLSLRAAWP